MASPPRPIRSCCCGRLHRRCRVGLLLSAEAPMIIGSVDAVLRLGVVPAESTPPWGLTVRELNELGNVRTLPLIG
jgi:hypothetical protein